MKALLDHYGWRWLVHRPEESMFSKQAVCISTAAGAGMKSTNRDMADSTFWWGVAKTYRYGVAVAAVSWENVSTKKKAAVEKKLCALARKIEKRQGRVNPSLKTRVVFLAIRLVQKYHGWSKPDREYWKSKGWTDKKRPWKN